MGLILLVEYYPTIIMDTFLKKSNKNKTNTK